MFLQLFGSSDRLGGNIGDIISQILYAIHNKIYITYNRENLRVYNSYNQGYNSTIFLQTLFDIIDFYNSKITDEPFTHLIDLAASTHYAVWSKTLLDLNVDLFTYFKDNVYKNAFRENLISRANEKGYDIPFDPKKTILVHLRLEDVKDRPQYDGRVCANHFKSYIENGQIPDEAFDGEFRKTYPYYNAQAPMDPNTVKSIIDKVLIDKPDHEVIIITNPNEYVSELPYRYISHDDYCHDLFLLCNSETLILSKSNFALSALFFGIAQDVHLPLWGQMTCFGLYTKFDKTNFKYFY
jgi:hypothetical protein